MLKRNYDGPDLPRETYFLVLEKDDAKSQRGIQTINQTSSGVRICHTLVEPFENPLMDAISALGILETLSGSTCTPCTCFENGVFSF